MKNFISVILIICALFLGIKTCDVNATNTDSNVAVLQPSNCSDYAKTRYLGSTKSLSGKTYIITVYAKEFGCEDFTENEKNNYRHSLYDACNYLKNQAKRYGKDVNFVCAEAFSGKTIYVNTLDKGHAGINSIYKQIFTGDYKSDFNRWMKSAGCDNYMVLVYTNRYGSCNNAESSFIASNFYCEGCMINKQTPNNFTSTIAHEMLHNFGAIDLYNLNFNVLGSDKSRFDYSIMVRTDLNNSQLNIDEITAYMVGLTDYEKDWYNLILRQY